MEIRLHGRGGQGGVTCAKILASVYAKLGKSVQTFGDYASERSGAPVRAYTRVGDQPITNRNKVYHPDHLLVLDPTLLGDLVLQGLRKGGSLLLNSTEDFASFDGRFEDYRFAVVDATAIARRHGIGTRSVVIINTTIAGAYAKMHGIALEVLESAYAGMGLASNFPAAKEAYEAVSLPGRAARGPRGRAQRRASAQDHAGRGARRPRREQADGDPDGQLGHADAALQSTASRPAAPGVPRATT